MRAVLFSLFGKDLHWIRLAGSLLALVALLQAIASMGFMSDAWDALNNFNRCSPQDASVCAEVLYRITGVSVWAGQSSVDVTQTLRIFIAPVAQFLGWLVVLIVGILLYKTGPVVAMQQAETTQRARKKGL